MKIDMKVAAGAGVKMVIPPIPLMRGQESDPKPTEVAKFKLKSIPTDANSPTYEFAVKFFKNGTPEEYILTVIALDKIFKGQNINTGQSST